MNWQTILVAVLVAAVILAIILSGIRNKKKGKGSCSCGCGGCAIKDSCHPKK